MLAALVISLAITSFFYVRFSKRQNRPSTKKIIVAAQALQPGTPITASDLSDVDWPVSVPVEGLIEKREDVIGHVLMYAVAAKQPVLLRDLASSTSYGLSAKIPNGMRATAVKTDEVANVAGFLFPGSHVDVMMTMRGEGQDTVSRTVIQNAEVLSTGTKIEPDPNGKPEDVKVVTLMVTPEQSEKLMLAQTQGHIQIVLRNGGDSATPEVASVDTNQLAGFEKKAVAEPGKPEMRHSGQAKAKPVKPPAYTVETIAAGKVTTASFPTEEHVEH